MRELGEKTFDPEVLETFFAIETEIPQIAFRFRDEEEDASIEGVFFNANDLHVCVSGVWRLIVRASGQVLNDPMHLVGKIFRVDPISHVIAHDLHKIQASSHA